MRRPKIGLVVIASCLAVAGCTTTDSPSPTPSPTPTPTPSTPAEPPVERRDLMSYPDRPSVAWTFTTQDSGVDPGIGDLAFVDPTLISDSVDGFKPPAPIDAGDTLVIAVEGVHAPYTTLVAIDAETGEARWTYAPERGRVTACAQDLLGSALACGIYDSETESGAGLVLVDLDTGQEVVTADLPGQAVALAVVGDSVVSLTADRAPLGEPEPYDVSAHDAAGELQWSTEVVKERNDFGRGRSEKVYAGPALAAVELSGSVAVLATDGGEVLLERDGYSWDWFPAGDDGGLLYDEAPNGEPLVTVVSADGSEVATLPGYEVLRPAVGDESESTYLFDPDGQIVSISTVNGETGDTGVTPTGTPAPTGFLETPSVTEVDGTLVVLRNATLFGHALSAGGPQAWERDADGWIGGLTDGSVVYAAGLGADGEVADGEVAISALDPAEGSLAWTTGVATGTDPFATLVRGGGHLIVMEPTSMTALAP